MKKFLSLLLLSGSLLSTKAAVAPFQSFDTNFFTIVTNAPNAITILLKTNLIGNTNIFYFYITTNTFVITSNIYAANIQGDEGRLSKFIANYGLTNSIARETNGSIVVDGSLGPFGEGFSTPGWYSTTNAANGPMNVRAFGATGDGITDDTTPLLSVRDAAQRDGASVMFPAGVHVITAPLYFTNVGGIYGVPGKTIIKPQGFSGAAITLITTNATAQNYSWPTVVSGLTIIGDNNVNGDGINIGTNYLFNANYTANVYLNNVVVRGFTNGTGLVLGNSLACEIAGCNFESNLVGVAVSSDTGVTTVRVHDSQLRRNIYGWQSTNSALYFGPNNIVEGNYRDGMIVGLAPYNFFQCVGNWFEDNQYFSLLNPIADPPTNHHTVTVYGSGSINLVTFRDGHFNTGAAQPLCLLTTNVSQVIWDGVSLATVITNLVRVTGNSHLLVEGAQQYQDGTWMFSADSPAVVSYNYGQYDPQQFTFDGYYNRIKNFRATSTENIWTNEIRVLNNGTATPGIILEDTAASGHVFWLHNRVAAAGGFGLYDQTAAAYRWIVNSSGVFSSAYVHPDNLIGPALVRTGSDGILTNIINGSGYLLNNGSGGFSWVVNPGTLINTTDGRIPVRQDASTFTNSPLQVLSATRLGWNGSLNYFTAGENDSIGIGSRALDASELQTESVAIGGRAMGDSPTEADYNVALGASAGRYLKGDYSVVIGRFAANAVNSLTNSYNVILGAHAGNNGAMSASTNSIVIGAYADSMGTDTANIGRAETTVIWLGGEVGWFKGNGSPETVVTAPVGSLYSRKDGGAGTTLYVKESGTGNTGWVAK